MRTPQARRPIGVCERHPPQARVRGFVPRFPRISHLTLPDPLHRGRQTGRMDPRIRAAVDASRHWYDDVFALHGIPVRIDGGLWSALGPPPPWHSAAKTLEPGVEIERVVRAVANLGPCAVADSFGD